LSLRVVRVVVAALMRLRVVAVAVQAGSAQARACQLRLEPTTPLQLAAVVQERLDQQPERLDQTPYLALLLAPEAAVVVDQH
jgi:hypothetical protein